MKQDNTKLAVKCNNGTFVGKETDELIIWKGIPYATQPVGKLRWKKALPAADDDGVYDATRPGHVPIGPANDSEGAAEFGEDCLVLNVYCNTKCPDSKKPVTTPELGTIHAAELPYLFDNPIPDPMGSGKIVSDEDCEFRHVAKQMWANFARTGNPSTDKYEWKKFSGDDRQTMVFGDTIGMQKDIFGRREDLMMSWAERLGNGSSKRIC